MGVSLTNGLSDLSKELGETSTNTTSRRIQHYNDAVVDFFNDRKYPFALKRNSALLIEAGNTLDLSDITDMREPGGVKEILVGDSDVPFTPIEYEDRNNPIYSGKRMFWVDPVTKLATFKSDVTIGTATEVLYFHIPARIDSTTAPETFPFPDRYRKTVSTLAAAYVQWGRYLETQGNRLYNLYTRQVGKTTLQQAERTTGSPRSFGHFMKRIGFRRTYP